MLTEVFDGGKVSRGSAGPPAKPAPSEPEPEPQRISLKEAIQLAAAKPDRKLTRKDLLVRGGWLHPVWEWSRDVGLSLDDAVLNCKKLGEEFKLVGDAPKLKAKPIRKIPAPKSPLNRESKTPRKGGFALVTRNPSTPAKKEQKAAPAPSAEEIAPNQQENKKRLRRLFALRLTEPAK